MIRSRKIALACLVSLPVLAGGFALQTRTTRGGAQLLDQVLTFVALRYVDTLDAQVLYEKAARGLVKELQDPYTELFSPKQLEEFSRSTSGRYAGIGMEILPVGGYVTIQKVFVGSPAESRGVQVGDKIVAIDTFNARNYTNLQAQNKLLGPVGTGVSVTFARAGVPQPIKLDFKRAEIHVPAVRYSIMIDDRVGYILLERFSEQTTHDVAASIKDFKARGAKGVVIDLRNNPGGILEEAFSMSNLFLPKGKELLSVRGRTEFQKFTASVEPLAPDIPLVVLVDNYSASASEIVAGALQDYDRALVLGTTSYGKGLVQSVYNLDGGYALKITTGKWYTPSGRSIQKERKFNADGQFLEVIPDSMETDSMRKAKPTYKSLVTGRTLYGGGAITPDVYVQPDTLTSVELKLGREIVPKSQQFADVLSEFAESQKGKVKADFVVTNEWRNDIYTRLAAKGVKLDRATYDAGVGYVDRNIETYVARTAFGDSLVKRHNIKDDNQLLKAVELLRKSTTQKDVYAAAALLPIGKPRVAKSGASSK